MKADRKLIEQIVAESVRRVLAEKRYQMPNRRWEDDEAPEDYGYGKPVEFEDVGVDYNVDTGEMTQGAPKSDGIWVSLYFKVTDWEEDYDEYCKNPYTIFFPTKLEFYEWDDAWKVIDGKYVTGAEAELDDLELSDTDIKKATEIANENIGEWEYSYC